MCVFKETAKAEWCFGDGVKNLKSSVKSETCVGTKGVNWSTSKVLRVFA